MEERKMSKETKKEGLIGRLDWFSMIVPLIGVIAMCIMFMVFPNESTAVLKNIRGFLGDDFGIYYAILGL